MNGVRIVGNPEDKMKRVAIVAHLYPNSAMVDEIKKMDITIVMTWKL